MVARVHDHAADLGTLAEMASPAGLAQILVLVVEVADLADRGHAPDADPADLTGRQADLRVVAFLCQQLGSHAGRPDDLATLARYELDVGDRGAQRDVGDRQGVADPGLGFGARDDHVTHLQTVGQKHVALLAVAVVEEADPGRPIRVVLDRGQPGRDAQLIALEIDPAIVLLLPAAAVADGEPAGIVAARAPGLGLEQRLMRLAGGDFLEGGPGHAPKARGGRLVAAQGHRQPPSKNSIFWPAARVTIALRQGVVKPLIRPRFVPRRFSLAFVVRTLTPVTLTLNNSSTAPLIMILLASPWTAKVYLPWPASSIDFSLITGRRMTS